MGAVSLFLAVDGGNSKTEVLLADSSGAVLGYARGGGSNHQGIGMRAAMSCMDALIQATREQAGLAADVRPELITACLAGVDYPAESTAVTDAVTAAGWAAKCLVDNDSMALLRAGTDAPDVHAVAVVCGAGTNCVARAADGRMVRFPSLGQLTGDWGGGIHLGAMALWHAIRAEDGRGPVTGLVGAITGFFGAPTVADVSATIHFGQLARDDLAGLTPLLFRVAAGGDPVARDLVVRQGEEIVTIATAALRRLRLLTSPVTVVLGGGVLRTRDPVLFGVITERLVTAAPRAAITLVTDPPVLGAALLALDAVGAAPAAQARLRDQVRALTAQ